jgi:hypothetical protein
MGLASKMWYYLVFKHCLSNNKQKNILQSFVTYDSQIIPRNLFVGYDLIFQSLKNWYSHNHKPGKHRMDALPGYLSVYVKSVLFDLYEVSMNVYKVFFS